MKVTVTFNLQGRIVEKKSANPCCIVQHAVYFIVCKPIVQNGTPKVEDKKLLSVGPASKVILVKELLLW